MKKRMILILFFIFQMNGFSQSFYLKNGKNITNFKFTRSDGTVSSEIQSGSGNFYELGYSSKSSAWNQSYFSYEMGLSLNDYNAIVGTAKNSITWKTNYFGLQSSLFFSFINVEPFVLDARLGINASKIIYGKEEVDGVVYDIKKTSEFKGVLLQYILGLEGRYVISSEASLGLGYNYVSSLDFSNPSEKFSIKTNQIVFSVYFVINN